MRRARPALDQLVAAALGGWVKDEHHRAPPTWRDRLGLLRAWRRGEATPGPDETEKALRARVEATAVGVLAQRRRWRTADRMVRSLRVPTDPVWTRTTDTKVDKDGQVHDRHRLALKSVYVGRTVVPLHGRAMPDDRRADPQRTASKLASCRRRWLVHQRASGALTQVPMVCDDPMCPDCMDVRAGQRRDRDTGAILALARARCPVGFVTPTLRNDRTRDADTGAVVLTEEDLQLWPELAELHRAATAEDTTASTTGGASLDSRLSAWLTVWRALMDNRKHRAWWEAHVLGYRLGIEVTARATDKRTGRATGPLGWHPHGHVVVVLRPTGEDPAAVLEELLRRWMEVAASKGHVAERAGQDAQVIAHVDEAGDVDAGSVARAVSQALKYPGKVGDMPAACVWEFDAVCRGRTMHRPGGLLHSATRSGCLARAVAVAELEREGTKATDDQGKPLEAAACLAACARWEATDEATARQKLAECVGGPLVGPCIQAWRSIVADVERDEAGEAVPEDPILGVLVRLIRGTPFVVTRARLRVWARAGAVLHLALAPPGTIGDTSAARAELVPLGRRHAAEVAASLFGTPPPARAELAA